MILTSYAYGWRYMAMQSRMLSGAHRYNPMMRSFAIKSTEPLNWQDATLRKARIIAHAALDPFESHARMLYLDADAEVVRHIPTAHVFAEMRRIDAPIAAHYLPDTPRGDDTGELISATLLMDLKHPKLPELLGEWTERCGNALRGETGEWDQALLQDVIRDGGYACYRLGPEWCWIDDGTGDSDMSSRRFGANVRPIIVQRQASRKYRGAGR